MNWFGSKESGPDNRGLSIGSYTLPGLDSNGPRTNEDAFAINEKKGVFGVFDGNGKTKELILESMNLRREDWSWARQKLGVGYDIADQFDPAELSSYLSEMMPSAFFDEMISDEENLEFRLRNLFAMYHNKVRDRCLVGTASTALLLYIDESGEELTVANCGDSRALLCRSDRAVQLTRDQKSDLNIGSEGFDLRQMSIHQERLDKLNDSYVVLLSDGVYNAFERGNDDVIEIINQKMEEGLSMGAIAKHLAEQARKREDDALDARRIEEGESLHAKVDDMTVVLICLSETLHLTPVEITEQTRLCSTAGCKGAACSVWQSPTFWATVFVTSLVGALSTAVALILYYKPS